MMPDFDADYEEARKERRSRSLKRLVRGFWLAWGGGWRGIWEMHADAHRAGAWHMHAIGLIFLPLTTAIIGIWAVAAGVWAAKAPNSVLNNEGSDK